MDYQRINGDCSIVIAIHYIHLTPAPGCCIIKHRPVSHIACRILGYTMTRNDLVTKILPNIDKGIQYYKRWYSLKCQDISDNDIYFRKSKAGWIIITVKDESVRTHIFSMKTSKQAETGPFNVDVTSVMDLHDNVESNLDILHKDRSRYDEMDTFGIKNSVILRECNSDDGWKKVSENWMTKNVDGALFCKRKINAVMSGYVLIINKLGMSLSAGVYRNIITTILVTNNSAEHEMRFYDEFTAKDVESGIMMSLGMPIA